MHMKGALCRLNTATAFLSPNILLRVIHCYLVAYLTRYHGGAVTVIHTCDVIVYLRLKTYDSKK